MVRQRSAKPLFVGSIPTAASNQIPQTNRTRTNHPDSETILIAAVPVSDPGLSRAPVPYPGVEVVKAEYPIELNVDNRIFEFRVCGYRPSSSKALACNRFDWVCLTNCAREGSPFATQ